MEKEMKFPVDGILEQLGGKVIKRAIYNVDTEWTAKDFKQFLCENNIDFGHTTTTRYDKVLISGWMPEDKRIVSYNVNDVDFSSKWYFQPYEFYFKKNDPNSLCMKVKGNDIEYIDGLWSHGKEKRVKKNITLFRRGMWS